MQNLKKMSVSLDSLPLDDIGFCDNWSYTFIGCFFLFVCLFVVFMQDLKKNVCPYFLPLLSLCCRLSVTIISSQTLLFYAKSENLTSKICIMN